MDPVDLLEQTETLIQYISSHNMDELKKSINSGIPLKDLRSSSGDTLLHIAIEHRDVEILAYLLDLNQIDIDCFNDLGKTALMAAVLLPDPRYTELLLDQNADLDISDQNGNRPLHHGTYYSMFHNCGLLLEHGADVNARNDGGFTALHLACELCYVPEWIYMFMYFGADPLTPGMYSPFEFALTCDNRYLQHIFWDYVIDGIDKMPVMLSALITPMRENNPLFPHIVDNVSEVIFGQGELDEFVRNLCKFQPQYLEIFLEKFTYVIEKIDYCNTCLIMCLCKFLERNPKGLERALENLYIVFREPFALYFVDNVNHLEDIEYDYNVLSELVRTFFRMDLPLDALSIIFYHLLSYGVELSNQDVDSIYLFYGDCELFRNLLHMDIHKYESYIYQSPPMPAAIYDMEFDLEKSLANSDAHFSLQLLIDFCSHPLVKQISLLISDKGRNLPDVPSLVELARDKSRQHIIKAFNVQNSGQFYTVLRRLPIANIHKDMISFRRKLYFL